MQDIEDRVFAGNDRSVTKSKAEQSVILTSFTTMFTSIFSRIYTMLSIYNHI